MSSFQPRHMIEDMTSDTITMRMMTYMTTYSEYTLTTAPGETMQVLMIHG
eukprot:CAMPEP_0114046130 /NCGR_PEP_ID=MMETSP1339-20121228/19179_1 /TAXON_ID=94617 /ORGANISM="Fibrocapsa japonica" /LENGTH=49 /assembly_acc=CAM_ASM_000762